MQKKSRLATGFCAVLVWWLACKTYDSAQPKVSDSVQPQSSQAANRNEWPWPDSLEALIAAPKNHKVILENERVRVFEVTIGAREKEPLQYPITQWMEPQAPHAVENLSDEPIHLIRVELKK